MSFKKEGYYTIIAQAKDLVPGFREAFSKFEERVVLDRLSKSLITNYGRNVAHLSLHFNRLPHEVSIEEINAYLYRKSVHEQLSESYFKQTVFGMRFWFRLFDLEAEALKLPMIKKDKKLPVVLSKEECKKLFKAPRTLKHRFLLAFGYSAGLRMNELRHIRISDIDTDRMQIRVRQGKGKKDRYVILSKFIKARLPHYLKELDPQVDLFEGQTPGQPMGERSIQYVIAEALHPKEMCNFLFFASRETLMTFGRDEKHLGADMGAISVLHTWGQNLSLHPHVHTIVPGGGIDKSGHWKHSKDNGKYLFPVKAMSTVYRGKFMENFKKFLLDNGMELTTELRGKLYAKDWVVFAKRPFGGPEQVIEYLGRYTHKIAISNHRLQRIDGGKVSFTYKDYRDNGKTKVMTLDALEFLRRFCMHILPKGFRKIRHYGILASRNKPKLKAQQDKMGINRKEIIEPAYDTIKGSTFKPKQCPCCKKETMQQVMTFKANAPPALWLLTHETKNRYKSCFFSYRNWPIA